jgi:signal transduction histidine kinase
MMQDVLDIHKLEMGKLKLDLADTTTHELISKCISTFELSAREKNVMLANEAKEDLKIVCDSNRIVQVLNNLTSNALKFVKKDYGKIEIIANLMDENIVFSVRDNGVGIPKEKIKNLFGKFYQVDTTLSRKAGGTGLGLAISKGLVEAHGGNIWVDSEDGSGTVVSFSIPQVRLN